MVPDHGRVRKIASSGLGGSKRYWIFDARPILQSGVVAPSTATAHQRLGAGAASSGPAPIVNLQPISQLCMLLALEACHTVTLCTCIGVDAPVPSTRTRCCLSMTPNVHGVAVVGTGGWLVYWV